MPTAGVPPLTNAGVTARSASWAGVTPSDTDFVTPEYVAAIVTGQRTATREVAMSNVAELVPAETITSSGTDAAPGSSDKSATRAPPEGALPLSVTVPVRLLPPATLGELNDKFERDAGSTVRDAVCVVPQQEAEIVVAIALETPVVANRKMVGLTITPGRLKSSPALTVTGT